MIPATFTRASVAHKLDGSQVASGVPRYEAGLNGQAIMVEEGTVNLYADGDYASGAATHPVRSGPWSVTADPTGRWLGNVLRANPHATTAYHGRDIPITTGATCTDSVWCYVSPDCDLIATRLTWEGGSTVHALYDMGSKGTWQLLTLSRSAPTTNMRLLVYTSAAFTTGFVLYRNMQAEAKPYATSFAPGTRAAETLSLPLTALPPQTFTLEVDLLVTDHIKRQITGTYPRWIVLDVDDATHGGARSEIAVLKSPLSANLNIEVWRNGVNGGFYSSAGLIANGWRRLALRGNGSDISLWCDGVRLGGSTTTLMPNAFTTCFLGQHNGGSQANTLFDRLRLYNRALTDAEIRASYEGSL